MKLFELTPLNFNSQAKLAAAVGTALTEKFGFKASVHLYDNGAGNIYVQLKKKADAENHELLGAVLLPWLRDNLTRLLERPVTKVTLGTGLFDSSGRATELAFRFKFEL